MRLELSVPRAQRRSEPRALPAGSASVGAAHAAARGAGARGITIGRYRTVLAVVAVAVFFTNFANYTERFGVIPLAWIALFGGLCVPIAIHGLVVGRMTLPPLVWWGGGYLLIALLWFYHSPQDTFAYEEVQLRGISVAFLVGALLVLADGSAQRAARVAIALATMLAVGLNVFELFNPQSFSTVVGRSAGLYGDSNQSATGLVLGLILGYGVLPGWLRVPFVAATAIGIFPTFSRSGILAWLLVVAFFMLKAGVSVAQLRRVAGVAVVVVGLLVSPLWGNVEQELLERGALKADVFERIMIFGGGGRAGDASASERMAVAAKAWSLVGEDPLRGHGTGTSNRIEGFEVGTHNTYLAMMVDHGFPVGVLVVPLLLLAVLWGAGRGTADLTIPFGAIVALLCLFSHTVLEDRYVLLSIGLTASVVATNRAPRGQGAMDAAPLGGAQRVPDDPHGRSAARAPRVTEYPLHTRSAH